MLLKIYIYTNRYFINLPFVGLQYKKLETTKTNETIKEISSSVQYI